jgi:DNA-directed RNA polymerase specialized sigma24 family protein
MPPGEFKSGFVGARWRAVFGEKVRSVKPTLQFRRTKCPSENKAQLIREVAGRRLSWMQKLMSERFADSERILKYGRVLDGLKDGTMSTKEANARLGALWDLDEASLMHGGELDLYRVLVALRKMAEEGKISEEDERFFFETIQKLRQEKAEEAAAEDDNPPSTEYLRGSHLDAEVQLGSRSSFVKSHRPSAILSEAQIAKSDEIRIVLGDVSVRERSIDMLLGLLLKSGYERVSAHNMAEDIYQDVCSRILSALDRGHVNMVEIKPYLVTSLKRELYNRVRKDRQRLNKDVSLDDIDNEDPKAILAEAEVSNAELERVKRQERLEGLKNVILTYVLGNRRIDGKFFCHSKPNTKAATVNMYGTVFLGRIMGWSYREIAQEIAKENEEFRSKYRSVLDSDTEPNRSTNKLFRQMEDWVMQCLSRTIKILQDELPERYKAIIPQLAAELE